MHEWRAQYFSHEWILELVMIYVVVASSNVHTLGEGLVSAAAS
jgi:hypothetical protein